MPKPYVPPSGIRVVYTDVDGTMLGYGGSFVHDPAGAPTTEPAQALAAAHAAGIQIVPVSGRHMPGIARDARILGMSVAIGELGAVTSYEMGREIVTHLGGYPFDAELPFDAIQRLGVPALLQKEFALEDFAPYHVQRQYTYLMRGRADLSEANAILEANGFEWLELIDNGRLHGAYLGLPPGESHAYHVIPRGVSKRAAVLADRERRGYAREETLAIGDAGTDLDMAAAVGTVVITDPALAEAVEGVENAALSPRLGNLGWADVISSLK